MSITRSWRATDAGADSVSVTTAYTVSLNDSGKVLKLNAAAGAAITLPAATDGFNVRIMTALAFGTSAWVITAPASTIEGHVLVNGAVVAASNENTITFAHAADALGDYVDLYSDGTSYFISGSAATAAAITLTVV